jgi:hypothetical protein
MQFAVRMCAAFTLPVLFLGVLVYYVVIGVGNSRICFDGCVIPGVSQGDALVIAVVTFGPGFLFALATWGLFLIALVRSRAPWQLALVGGGPIVPVGVYIVLAVFVPPIALLPTTNEESLAWLWKVLLTGLVTLGLLVAMFVLVPSTTEADQRAADFASLRDAHQEREAKEQQLQAAQQRLPHADGSEIARLTAELAMLRSNAQAWDRYCRARWPQRSAYVLSRSP